MILFWSGNFQRLGLTTLLAIVWFANPGIAKSTSADEPADQPELLKAVPGTKVKLECETNAVGMDFEPFRTTTGALTILLTFEEANRKTDSDTKNKKPDPSVLGSWSGSVAQGKHTSSLGVSVEKHCTTGCVLRKTPSGNMELWSPRPIMPSKLADDERLSIVMIDVKSLEIKATSFLGEQLSILEKGQCKIVKP